MWRARQTDTAEEPSRVPGAWTCQLIRAERVADVLVLDMVDIDDDPYDTAVARPRGPFTLHVEPGRELMLDIKRVMRWAARADVITMIAGRSGELDWLSMSSDERQLVIEVSGASDQPST